MFKYKGFVWGGIQCPNCGSNDTMSWASGYICRDCGHEW